MLKSLFSSAPGKQLMHSGRFEGADPTPTLVRSTPCIQNQIAGASAAHPQHHMDTPQPIWGHAVDVHIWIQGTHTACAHRSCTHTHHMGG